MHQSIKQSVKELTDKWNI